MPVASSLAAHVTPIPCLSPHWGALVDDVPDGSVSAPAKHVLDILCEVEGLKIRLNDRGAEASAQLRAESDSICRELEELEPGILHEMYLHHVDSSDAKQWPAHGVLTKSSEKRKVGAKDGVNKKQKLTMPDSWRTEEAETDVQDVPATQQLCELLQQVLHDESLAQTYWQDIIQEITSETQKVRAKGLLNQIPVELIKSVMVHMQNAVQDMTQAGKWDEAKKNDDESEAEMCLAVVHAALGFLSEAELGPVIYNDDLIETIVGFTDGFVNQVVLPSLDKALKDHLALESETATGKRRKSREHSRDVRGVLKRKVDSVSHVILVLGDVVKLKVRIQDQQCISISRICLGTFFVDFPAAAYHLQQACVGLMQSIFAQYPDHREHIIQEIAARAVSWKPVPKDFCFQLKAPKLGQIQMISALLFSLLQSCCDDVPPRRDQTAEETQINHPALMLLIMFIKNVQLKMNVKKIDKSGESGYKMLFQSLVADVCWVLGAPEWPIATLVLKALVKYSYEMCSKESYPSQYRLDAAKLLGDIVVRVKQLSLTAEAPDLKLLGGKVSDSDFPKDHPVVLQLIQQQEEVLRHRLSTSALSPVYAALSPTSHESLALAQKLVSQQLLLNYLVVRSTKDQGIRHAKQNWIWQWCHDANSMPPGAAKCYEWYWNEANYRGYKMIDGDLDPSAQEAAAYATFLCSSYDYAETLKPLLVLLKHPKMPQFRQRALKALSQVIELDPLTLANDAVRDAVCGSMTDPAKSVRAEAVSLVGKFMCNSQELMLHYYESICMRCRDSGSSVRKAAMNILRDLFFKCKDRRVIDRACIAIIPLLKDESEDICKRAFAFLRELWFPSSLTERDQTARNVLSVAARFEQMRSVVEAAHKTNTLVGRDSLSATDVLEHFMKETLKSKEEAIRECEEYCKEALQAIIRSQEMNGNASHTRSGEGGAFDVGDRVESQYKGIWRSAVVEIKQGTRYKLKWNEGPQDDAIREEATLRSQYPDANLLSLFRTLALLARVHPELVVKDVELLCKFLSSQERVGGAWSKGQCEMMGTVAAIYDCVLPHVQDPSDLLIKYLQQDLPMLIQYAPAMPLITISIKCLCTMVKSVGSSRRRAMDMYTILQKCFRYETRRLSDPNFKAKPRSLIVAGLFCRFSDFKLHLDSGKVIGIEDARVQEIFSMCITKYVQHESMAFKRAGFSCLGSLLVRIPRLAQTKEAQLVLVNALEDSNEDIRSLAVSALDDFVGEDVADTDATSLRNAIMQKFLDKILRCVYCQKDDTAAAALRLVATIHDRGQVHPQLCIPDMIAVQQRSALCAGVGFQVLKCINEKYPEYNSAQVFVQGVIKGHGLKISDSIIATENFSRAFELRLPNKKYVMQTISTVIDKVKKGIENKDSSPRKSQSKPSDGSAAGGAIGRSLQEMIVQDVECKCFLLSVVSLLPFPDQECVQHMISQAAMHGIQMGSETKVQLKMLIEEREALGKTAVDAKAIEHMHGAARACLLLDMKRFLQVHYQNRKDKVDFPAEIGVPLQPENILKCTPGEDMLGHAYERLKTSLRVAAEDKLVTASVVKKKRGRPATQKVEMGGSPAKTRGRGGEGVGGAYGGDHAEWRSDEDSMSSSDFEDEADDDDFDNEHYAMDRYMSGY